MTRMEVAWRPVVVILALVAAAVGAVYLAVALTLDDDVTDPGGPVVAQDAAQESAQEPTSLDADIDFRVTTYEVFLSRDPFQPLLPQPAAAPGDPGSGDPVPGDPVPGDPDPTPGDPSPTPAPTDGCTQNAEVVCDGRVVTLVDTFVADDGTPTAVVRVDNEVFEVVEGQTFATNFRVRVVEPPCVELVFGDEAFRLCEGEAVLK
jgi:hypothetical protein